MIQVKEQEKWKSIFVHVYLEILVGSYGICFNACFDLFTRKGVESGMQSVIDQERICFAQQQFSCRVIERLMLARIVLSSKDDANMTTAVALLKEGMEHIKEG
jgi:hypothetical protein